MKQMVFFTRYLALTISLLCFQQIKAQQDLINQLIDNLNSITLLQKTDQKDLIQDPYLLEGYFLTKTSYRKHKKYITQNIGQLNMDVFEYCLRQYSSNDFKEIRKLYKENLME